MKRGVLLLNGEPYTGEIIKGDALVYCCDGAYSWAKHKVAIDKNIGDFDSLDETPYPLPDKIYPSEKDFTDGEIAIRQLIENGARYIEIYGGGGGREDHFVGNLQLLYFCHSMGVKAVMITNYARIFAAKGRVQIGNYLGQTFSVFPFGGVAHIISSKGIKYAEPSVLGYGSCMGVSNVVTESDAEIVVAEGDSVLLFINGGEQ